MSVSANKQRQLKWQGDWRTTLFVVAFLPVFVTLGFWQLERAQEKQQLAESAAQRRAAEPRMLAELPETAEELAYRRVILEGEFIPGRDFLLDNRIFQGKYGVEVLSPFQQVDGTVVLVNRGWMAADPARRSLPQVPVVEGPQRLLGSVYVSPGEAYVLGEIQTGDVWPRMVQAVDIGAIEQVLGQSLFPYSVRLQADSSAALTVDWQVINVSPDKHRAYAVQWFSMAVVLVLIYLWRSIDVVAGAAPKGVQNDR